MRWCPLSWVLRWARCLRFRFLGISLGHPFLFAWFFVCTRLAYGGAPFFVCFYSLVSQVILSAVVLLLPGLLVRRQVWVSLLGVLMVMVRVVVPSSWVVLGLRWMTWLLLMRSSLVLVVAQAVAPKVSVRVVRMVAVMVLVFIVFPFWGFLVFPPYHSTHMIHKFGVGGVPHTLFEI